MAESLKATVLICTLSPSPQESSSDKMAHDVGECLEGHNVTITYHRLADYNIVPGVESNMGESDQWPTIRKDIVDADILIVSTPTWVGHMSSFAQRALERLDAEISIEDDEGKPGMFDKVAGVAVVGNEDGAHKISGDIFQSLNDIGFTIPANGVVYWNDEAMGSREYKDFEEIPNAVSSTMATFTKNLAHLASVLKLQTYPA